MQRKWLWFVIGAIVLIAIGAVLVWVVPGFPVTPVVARIEEAGFCRGSGPDGEPEGVTDVFPPDIEVIYLYFRLNSNTWLQMEFRWYYEGELLGTFTGRQEPELNYVWITTPSPDQPFSEGEYSVEIVVGDSVERRLGFEVRER